MTINFNLIGICSSLLWDLSRPESKLCAGTLLETCRAEVEVIGNTAENKLVDAFDFDLACFDGSSEDR